MMNDNEPNAIFDPRDGDPHHIAAYDHDEPFRLAQLGVSGALLLIGPFAFAGAVAACWLS